MTPLRIHWKMLTPAILSDQPLHFDSLLAWAAAMRAEDDLYPIQDAIDDLPLQKDVRDSGWVWKASHLEFKHLLCTQPMVYYRAQDPELIADEKREIGGVDYGRKRVIDPNKGSNKRCVIYASMRYVSEAEAWCIGDKDAIKDLLSDIDNLGKLARLDYGRVLSVSVNEDKRAFEFWKRRTLPWPEPEYARTVSVCTPPYWDRRKQTECWVPVC